MASILKISILLLVVMIDCLNAAGGPRRRIHKISIDQYRQNQRIQKSLNVDGFNIDSVGEPRERRNLANVFPFVGGERGDFRSLDPVLHNSRHDEHADHVAHHADHLEHQDEHHGIHDEHQVHHEGHHDQHQVHHEGHHDQHHGDHHDEHHAEHNDHHGLHEEPSFNPVPNTLIDSRSARQRNGGNEVSLDIGSIAAAGERCIDKVVMVQETEYDDVVTCKHSYSEKCHITYTTDFVPQQEEKCVENYIKSCFIEYKKVASQEQVDFCHTPLICEGEGPIECSTVYESQCQTRYEEHDVDEDKVACETIQEEKCEDVTQGYTTEEKCTKWPKQVCQKTNESTKKYSPETECKKVPRQLCGASGCQLAAGPEECFKREETVVQEVPEENCHLEPQRSCKHVTKLVPLLKPVEECVDIPKEICSRSRTNPRVVQKPVVKKWCYIPSAQSGLA